jgi:hypothetical protein
MAECAGTARGGIYPLPALSVRTASGFLGAVGRSGLLFAGDYWADKLPLPAALRASLKKDAALFFALF